MERSIGFFLCATVAVIVSVSASASGRGECSVDAVERGECSVDALGRGECSVNEYGRGKCSVNEYGRGKCSVDEYGRGKCSVDEYVRGECSSSASERGGCEVAGDIRVVNLYGSWREMGEQYGFQVKEQLEDVHRYIVSKTAGSPQKEAAVNETAESVFSHYPDYLRDFFEGVSTSSGISMDVLKRVNAVEYCEPAFFCSGLAVWGDFAKGKLLYGRNYDAVSYSEIGKDLIVTVFHPSDGSLATAIVGYAGEIYAVNALNEAGVFLALNNGTPSAGPGTHFEIPLATTLLLELALRAEDLEEVDDFFHTCKSSSAFIIGVADKNEARGYEWCYDGVERADTEIPNTELSDTEPSDLKKPDGLMAIANHYVNRKWTYPVPSDSQSWNSITRRENMISYAMECKGLIDRDMLMTIMQTSIEDGGPCHDLTRYQIVVEPESFTMWIRVVGYADWTKLKLF